jgi:MFS family permease
MFVKGIPPIIFTLFIGPWSDRFGRKFLIVLPLIGYVFYNVWFLINVIFYDFFPVEWLMLEVIQFWFGGFMCLFLGLYSYVSDISAENVRTVRIAIVDFVFFSGMAIGSGISGKIFVKFGYIAIYSIGGVLQVLAILYAVFFVKESKLIRAEMGLDKTAEVDSETVSKTAEVDSETASKTASKEANEDEGRPGCCSIFSLHHIKESFGVAFKKRPGGVMHVVVMLILLFGLYGFANNGIGAVNITYARGKFEWETTDKFQEWWARYQSVGTVFNLFAIGVIMPIMTQVMHLRDLAITLICVLSSLAGIATVLFAEVAEVLYLANGLRMFSDVVTVGIRSALTKIVGSNDVGKVRIFLR